MPFLLSFRYRWHGSHFHKVLRLPQRKYQQYNVWCALWIMLGIVMLLFRVGVIPISSTNTLAIEFFGSGTASYNSALIIFTAVQLGLMVRAPDPRPNKGARGLDSQRK